MPPSTRSRFTLCVPALVLAAALGFPLAAADVDAEPDVDLSLARQGQPFTNSIGMKFAPIPTGKFMMGTTEEERDAVRIAIGSKAQPDWLKAEGPRHQVELTKDFFMGVYEVTQKQYKDVMGSNPSYFRKDGGGAALVRGMDTGDFPVDSVSWDDAQEFCKKLSELPAEKKAGRKYRLPTEAEWEYGCRAGADVKEPFTFDKPSTSASSTQANFAGNQPYGGGAEGPHLGRTCKVGSYRANPFGLYDMHGNVWEWCLDWYDSREYGRKDRRDPRGPVAGQRRVLRGGMWNAGGRNCRSGYRVYDSPGFHGNSYGFRVVRVLRDG